jgi:hypothetical protein
MGRSGVYTGSHTKIFLSEEGTIWPDDPSEPRLGQRKRWSVDGIKISIDEEKAPNSIKQARYRYLAQLARAYRTKQHIKELPQPPKELWPAIESAGGILEWMNNDEKLLGKFWEMVKQQESGNWTHTQDIKRRRR